MQISYYKIISNSNDEPMFHYCESHRIGNIHDIYYQMMIVYCRNRLASIDESHCQSYSHYSRRVESHVDRLRLIQILPMLCKTFLKFNFIPMPAPRSMKV